MTKREQALYEEECKLEVASSAPLSALHSTLAMAKEVRKCHEELEEAEERLRVAQIAARKACDDDKIAKEEALKFEVVYITGVERRHNETGGWLESTDGVHRVRSEF